MHVTVAAADGLPTPVRMKPLPVVLEAPPDSFAWGSLELQTLDLESAPTAVPTHLRIAQNSKMAYLFNSEASKAIWCSAGAFRGEAPVVP